MVRSLPAPLLGAPWGTALEAPPCRPPVLRVSFLWRLLAGWLGPSVSSLASLILFMLVFTIRSGVLGQAAPPGVGRAVLFEPVWLDWTVPRPTEDTVM